MIVLDVNAGVAMAQGTEEGKALGDLILTGEEIIAPHFYLTEAANVAWKYVRVGQLDEEGSHIFLETIVDLVDRFVPAEEILIEALHLSIQNDHPLYDMLYLAVARRNAATLFTLDKKLRAICESNSVNCVGMARL